jgi:hypothetical protein
VANSKSDDEQGKALALTSLDYFEKTYGSTFKSDEKRALQVFKDFESKERLMRLQRDLIAVKDNKVSEAICDQVIGKSRIAKFQSYSNWAKIMLLRMNELR